MTAAQLIMNDYKKNKYQMYAEALVQGKQAEVMAWQGINTFPIVGFEDGSMLEFKVRFGEIKAVKVLA